VEGDHLNNSIEREKIGRAFGGHGKKKRDRIGEGNR
jgi:hypothetical protein